MASEVFLEYNIHRVAPGSIYRSDARKATEEDIARVKSKPCNHADCDEQLIIDEPGWLYDLRSCAVCGAGLGAI